jgi:hypothetical protein
MPLDTAGHIRAAWHLATWLDHHQRRHHPEPEFTPAREEIGAAMDRIQLAAASAGMGMFPYPPGGPGTPM